jgi:hypothetical protein
MAARKKIKPHGTIRQSQIITTFGPGALVDLPDHSVIIAGIEYWTGEKELIKEERLQNKVAQLLNVPSVKLKAPPVPDESSEFPNSYVRAWLFPEWFVTQEMRDINGGKEFRSRRIIHREALTANALTYIDESQKKHKVVPMRFVRTCTKGHIGDIDWPAFVHSGKTDCRRPIWMDERGTSGDLSEISIRCECGANREFVATTFPRERALGYCNGARPWLGDFSNEECGEVNRLLIRSASNAYFPQKLTVISLPDKNEVLSQAVIQCVSQLQKVEKLEQLETLLDLLDDLKEVFKDFTAEEIFEELMSQRKAASTDAVQTVKEAEIKVLTSTDDPIGADEAEGWFHATKLPPERWQAPHMEGIEQVVLVHRLREVTALVGFTRLEAFMPDIDGELDADVERAALAQEISWVPAFENRGEGIFLHFNKEAIKTWEALPRVKDRRMELTNGFIQWQQAQSTTKREFCGLPYFMLHSLSHLLITALSLECGYPASSIRERIYANENGYGILLYTGTPDAEGTLGGLIEAGKDISKHLAYALELGRLCSNDPVCAQHKPDNELEKRYLHGAACHGCLLIAETSCEMNNEFLDRALVVPTLMTPDGAFFSTATLKG